MRRSTSRLPRTAASSRGCHSDFLFRATCLREAQGAAPQRRDVVRGGTALPRQLPAALTPITGVGDACTRAFSPSRHELACFRFSSLCFRETPVRLSFLFVHFSVFASFVCHPRHTRTHTAPRRRESTPPLSFRIALLFVFTSAPLPFLLLLYSFVFRLCQRHRNCQVLGAARPSRHVSAQSLVFSSVLLTLCLPAHPDPSFLASSSHLLYLLWWPVSLSLSLSFLAS